MLDEIEQHRLAPLQVVEDADERATRCLGLEELAERPGRLGWSRGRCFTDGQEPEERPSYLRRELEGRQCVGRIGAEQLLQDLRHWPVGDPLPVRKAAPTEDGGVV